MSTAGPRDCSVRVEVNSAGVRLGGDSFKLEAGSAQAFREHNARIAGPHSPQDFKDGVFGQDSCSKLPAELAVNVLEPASDWDQSGAKRPSQSSTSTRSSESKRPHSRASAASAPVASKPNDAKFWFTKAKAVYSCRPYSPPKKPAATSPKKTARVPFQRSASVASVWPVTELTSESLFKERDEQGSNQARRNSSSSMQIHSYKLKGENGTGLEQTRTTVSRIDVTEETSPSELTRAQLRRSEVEEDELVAPARKKDSQADFESPSSINIDDSQLEHGGSSQHEASEVCSIARRESGKNASTSSPSPPPRSRSVASRLVTPRTNSMPDLGRDGGSSQEDLSRVFRAQWGDLESFEGSDVKNGTEGEHLEGKLPVRRKTWSPHQLQQSNGAEFPSSLSLARRSRRKSAKGSPTGKSGAHRKRSHRGSEKKGTVDGLRDEMSRSSLVSKAAYEVQLSAEQSVRAWAAENRPPRKGVELAIKAAEDTNMNLATNFERVKNKAKQLDAQLARLTEVSANLDRSLSTYEELTRGDQEALQKLNDVMEITEAEGMTTKKYEHILTRAREELIDLKGSVDAITRETQAAERARAAVAQRQDHARAESAAAREDAVRARCEMGGLHSAWNSELDVLKQEQQQKDDVNRFVVRRQRMRHRIMRELDLNPKTPPHAQSGEAASAVFSSPVAHSPNRPPNPPCDVSDGAGDVSFEQLTGLVGTGDVPGIISMYAERKEKGTRLAESKERAEERLRRLKEEKASLEVALKEVVFVDYDHASGAQVGLKSGIVKKEDRLRRGQERTLATERDVSLLGTCLWQLLSKLPDATDALQSLPAAYFQESVDNPNPQTPAVAPRLQKAPSKGNSDGKRGLSGKLKAGGGKEGLRWRGYRTRQQEA